MPGDEYASATGGSLKLKGVNSSSKITKKKKKRPKSPKESPERTEQRSKSEDRSKPAEEDREVESDALAQQDSNAQNEVEDDTALRNRGKTEAEIRHEERRRRRVGLVCFYYDRVDADVITA